MEFDRDYLEERYELTIERIKQIAEGGLEMEGFDEYFRRCAAFLMLIDDNKRFLAQGGLKTASVEELTESNHALYQDVMPERYGESFGNPETAAEKLGEAFGPLLCFLHRELFSLIAFCYQDRLEELVIRMELFVEVYGAFEAALKEEKKLPEREEIRQILYWFVSDYSDVASQRNVEQITVHGKSASVKIMEEADLSDIRYLFAYGEYVGENEIGAAKFLGNLPQETIDLMADTYTEGYRIGFELTGKDLSKKKTVTLIYPIGFERMMKKATDNFQKMGLSSVGADESVSIFYGQGAAYGVNPNRQYSFDHKDDIALFLDKALVERKIEVLQTAFEEHKDAARGQAGPAVLETFGERDFEPVNKPHAAKMTEDQNELWVDYRMRSRQLRCRYIPEEERSFTIIAFPLPEIREALPDDSMETYGKFFEEIIRINTLNYQVYRDIQATIIDVLNRADYCIIKGMNGNRTDLRVNL